MRRSQAELPQLITTAHESSDDEFDKRRKKYAVMMSIRTLCVIGAAVVYGISPWLSVAFLVGGAVLPWCAVLIANDRPPKKRAPDPRFHPDYNTERAITAGTDRGRVIDG